MNKEEMLREDRRRDLRTKRFLRRLAFVLLAFFVLWLHMRDGSGALPLVCLVLILGTEVDKLYRRIEQLESKSEGAPSPEGAP